MNAPERPPQEKPRLDPGFAARVMREADEIVARRRRMRRMAAGSVFLAFVSIFAAFGLRAPPAPGVSGPVASNSMRNIATAENASALQQSEDADAVDYLLPDAEPVARFADGSADTSDDSDMQEADEETD